jgi:hypothetical protein
MAPFTPSFKYVHTCLDHGHKLGLLEIEAGEEEGIELNSNH